MESFVQKRPISSFASRDTALPYLAIYVLSGACQPLLMCEVHAAGLGDARCQLYMVFYYLGMSFTGLLQLCRADDAGLPGLQLQSGSLKRHMDVWTLLPCVFVAFFGITAQSLNWAGNMRAGSSIFAVVYASVTIWAALLSRILLQRRLSRRQWLSIGSVFGGLALTGLDAKSLGPEVFMGSLMIATGTILHATCHTPFRS
ncbi:unnamed protein product [Durusdinium trenchii]|uniref:EamA domain-containing protein n=1 Tax=Durusdinium trenchii TaxID=1381693 RepID=A0ABP0SNJ5_9DINO